MANEHTDGRSKPIHNGMNGELITATLFPDYERPRFTYQLYGPNLMLSGEFSVGDIHDQMTGRGQSGYWNYYKLSNGGFYMAPKKDERLHITWPHSDFDDVLTSDASGVVATLFTLKFILVEFRDAHVEAMFLKLEDFARSHAESQKILRAIDWL